MAHGGKRAGAGRKRNTERALERVRVGHLCERKQLVEQVRQARGRLERRPEWQKAQKTLQGLFEKNKHRRLVNGLPDWEMKIRDTERAEHDRVLERELARVHRPKGHRSAIIAEVAKETGHSERMVRLCWVEYRADRAARVRAMVERMNWVALPDIGKI